MAKLSDGSGIYESTEGVSSDPKQGPTEGEIDRTDAILEVAAVIDRTAGETEEGNATEGQRESSHEPPTESVTEPQKAPEAIAASVNDRTEDATEAPKAREETATSVNEDEEVRNSIEGEEEEEKRDATSVNEEEEEEEKYEKGEDKNGEEEKGNDEEEEKNSSEGDGDEERNLEDHQGIDDDADDDDYDSQPVQPEKMFFGAIEYTKSCKIGTRCSVSQTVEYIETYFTA